MTELLVLLVSLSLGSFANTVISYFTGRSSFNLLRSYCFCNERKLKISELVPVLSFFFLKGKCRECGEKIPFRYLLVELLAAGIGLAGYLKFSLTPEFYLSTLIFLILMIIGMTDYYTFKIPNLLLLILFPLIITFQLVTGKEIFYNLVLSVILVLFFFVFNEFHKLFRNTGAIGAGDIKLIAVLAFLAEIPLPLIGLWVSSVLGLSGFLLLKSFNERFKEEQKIPYGLFLCLGFFFTIYFEPLITESYNYL